MQVYLFRKKEEEAPLFFEQGNNGTPVQDLFLPRCKILSNRRKMSNGKRSSRKEEERCFDPTTPDSLLRRSC
jgi:hypothetical protein